MLQITGNIKPEVVISPDAFVAENSPAMDVLQRTPGEVPVPLRQLPRPLFLERLGHQYDLTRRAHVRWCIRRAIWNCENLKRSDRRLTEYTMKPWHRFKGYAQRAGHIIGPKEVLEYGRYYTDLRDNLRKLLCPPEHIESAMKLVELRLRKGWGLSTIGLEDDPREKRTSGNASVEVAYQGSAKGYNS